MDAEADVAVFLIMTPLSPSLIIIVSLDLIGREMQCMVNASSIAAAAAAEAGPTCPTFVKSSSLSHIAMFFNP